MKWLSYTWVDIFKFYTYYLDMGKKILKENQS
jgi:hypothetical protein